MNEVLKKLVQFRKLNDRVDHHRWSPEEWLEQHEHVCKRAIRLGPKALAGIYSKLFRRATDDRNLGVAWDAVELSSGSTPGPDGETVETIGEENKWAFVRSVRDELRDGVYEPGETRLIIVPKKSGTGTRPIHIPTFADRMVQRAIVQVSQPLLDSMFLDCSFGFRPGRGRLHSLVRAQEYFEEGRTVVVVEDLKDAFEQVPQERVLQLFRKHLPNNDLLALISQIIRGPSGKGVMQGGALSPLCLNLWLHHTLDRQWQREDFGARLIRVADDLALFSFDKAAAKAARAQLARLVRSAGFQLKASATPTMRDLAEGDRVRWLGFEVGCDSEGRLTAKLSERSWKALTKKLRRYVASDSPATPKERVMPKVLGWLRQQGPTWRHESRPAVVARLRKIFGELDIQQTLGASEVLDPWYEAHCKWVSTRRSLQHCTDW